MKKFFLIASIFISTWACGQSDSLLRTDGVYIFDNGLDTVRNIANSTQMNCAQYVQVARGQIMNDKPCGLGDAVPIDITSGTFLTCLIFFSDSTGRTMTIGSCREEQNIRNKALRCLNQETTQYEAQRYTNLILNQLLLHQDSSITFSDSLFTAFREEYSGKAYRDSLVLNIDRSVARCDQLYSQRRTYIFYSYADIFDCEWVYAKPINIYDEQRLQKKPK